MFVTVDLIEKLEAERFNVISHSRWNDEQGLDVPKALPVSNVPADLETATAMRLSRGSLRTTPASEGPSAMWLISNVKKQSFFSRDIDIDSVVWLEEIDGKGRRGALDDIPETLNKNGVLYIHGFNNKRRGIESAARRISEQWGPQVIVFAFYWPSQGKPWAYKDDRRMVTEVKDCLCQTHLAEVIQHLANKVKKLHILAHSMGNRLLLRTLLREMNLCDVYKLNLGQLFCVAADEVDVVFKKIANMYVNVVDGITSYCSDIDIALMVSASLINASNNYIESFFSCTSIDEQQKHRAGKFFPICSGRSNDNTKEDDSVVFKTVLLDTEFTISEPTGHSYFVHEKIVDDMKSIICQNFDLVNRTGCLVDPHNQLVDTSIEEADSTTCIYHIRI